MALPTKWLRAAQSAHLDRPGAMLQPRSSAPTCASAPGWRPLQATPPSDTAPWRPPSISRSASSVVPRAASQGQQTPPAAAASSNTPPGVDRSTYNASQAAAFSSPDTVRGFSQRLPEDIERKLRRIVQSVPGLGQHSRVIDVGSGTGCLIPHMQAQGVKDILAVDLSAPMLEVLKTRYAPHLGTLGNQIGVRTWVGDVMDLPNYLGWAADAFFFNAVFGNLHDPRAALLKACLMLKPGGHIVISHPLGHTWHSQLAAQQPDITPHQLPDWRQLRAMIADLPLRIVEYKDEKDLYLAVLQVPPRYALPDGPLRMAAPVVKGFGRGSRQMGTPTANMDPEPLASTLAHMHQGVYYGWARLVPRSSSSSTSSWRPEDLKVHKMVMNVGRRPTVNSGDEAPTVEVHVMHNYPQDFYGEELRVVVLGYIRPEMRFPGGLPQLIDRIKTDVAVGRNQLDDAENKKFMEDSFLLSQ